MIQEEMFKAYKQFVEDGVLLKEDTLREHLMLGAMGLAGEAGEVCDELKKITMHDKGVNVIDLIKEMGDVLWYYTVIMNAFGITWEEIMVTNVEKLTERYPDTHLKNAADAILAHEKSTGIARGFPSKWAGGIRLVPDAFNDRGVESVVTNILSADKAPRDFEPGDGC